MPFAENIPGVDGEAMETVLYAAGKYPEEITSVVIDDPTLKSTVFTYLDRLRAEKAYVELRGTGTQEGFEHFYEDTWPSIKRLKTL